MSRSLPADGIVAPIPGHAYSLAEPIDLAEHNHPRTRIARYGEYARNSIARFEDLQSAIGPLSEQS